MTQITSAPTIAEMYPPHAQHAFEQLLAWQESSKKSTHILGVPMNGQEEAWRQREERERRRDP